MSKIVIGIKQVLQQLKDGLTREDIALHYNISISECKQLFKHPELAGRKTIKKPSFVIVADSSDEQVGESVSENKIVQELEVETKPEPDPADKKEVETVKDNFGEKFLGKTEPDKEVHKVPELVEETELVEEKVVPARATWN
jgi:hypothetical protein